MSIWSSRPAALRHQANLRRGEMLAMISALMALMAMGIDMMLPAFDDISDEYGLAGGSSEAGQTITIFFLGLAVGQLIFGPLADRFGRKATLYGAMVVYIAASVASVFAPTFAALLATRFVWGVGAAGSRVVATAIVRDVFSGMAMARAMSQIMAVFVLVPVVAPSVGAGLIAFLPWRSIFWFCVLWAIAVGIWSLRLSETLNPADARSLDLRTMIDGYWTVARTRVTMGYSLAGVFLQGVFTAYLATSEAMITDILGRDEAEFPVVFGAVAVLFGVGALANGRAVRIWGVEQTITRVLAAQVVLAGVLVVTSVATDGSPNFWFFMSVLGVLLATFMFLMPNLNAAAMEPVGRLAGTASAFTGAIRMALGAVLGTVISSLVDDTVTPFAVGTAVMVTGVVVTVAVVRVRVARAGAVDVEPLVA